MKKITLFMLIGCSFGCKKYWSNFESSSLNNFTVKSGVHCESSALLNALNHQGYDLTEEEILGAGAVLGFVYQKGKFPFLGGRTLKLKENLFESLDIKWYQGEIDNETYGWQKIFELISSDTPVVLRVDMRFLPYLHGGQYGSKYTSFGWHVITLTGLDSTNEYAYVTDTAYEDLQKIRIKDLHKARFSNLKEMPPNGEFYWIEKVPDNFVVDWEIVTKKSLYTIANGMLNIKSTNNLLLGLDGMSHLSEQFNKLGEDVPEYLVKSVLEFIYGFIEIYGTGGAAFREPYLNFLIGKSNSYNWIKKYVTLLQNSVNSWDNLSDYLKNMSDSESDRDYTKLATFAEEVFESEKAFYTSIK